MRWLVISMSNQYDMPPLSLKEKTVAILFLIIVVVLWTGVIATMLGYYPIEPSGSGGAKLNSPLTLSVPVLECQKGKPIIIDNVLSEMCTGDTQGAGQLYIPGGYKNGNQKR